MPGVWSRKTEWLIGNFRLEWLLTEYDITVGYVRRHQRFGGEDGKQRPWNNTGYRPMQIIIQLTMICGLR